MKERTGKMIGRWRRVSRTLRWVLLILVVLLVGFRLALPFMVEKYVNRKLDQLPEYDGQIGDVDIHLLRGAYSIERIEIVKTTGDVPVPFFSSPRVEFSIEWRELIRGSMVGEIIVHSSKVNFVKGPSEQESQTKIDKSWVGIVEDLFPFQINRFEFINSEVWFRDFHSKPKVDLYLTNLHLLATNLTNSRELITNLPAACMISGQTLGEGYVNARIGLNLLEKDPTFDLNASVTNIDLTAFNDFLRAYAKVDVSQGQIDIFTEIAASDGKFEGYVKPLVHDLNILEFKEDSKNPVKLFWESVIAVMAKIFRNQSKDQFGTKIPLSGSFDKPEVGVLPTIGNLLKNAFLEALSPRLDNSVDPKKVERKARREEEKKKKE